MHVTGEITIRQKKTGIYARISPNARKNTTTITNTLFFFGLRNIMIYFKGTQIAFPP